MATSRKPEASRSPALPGIQLDEQLCFALYAASLAMTKIYRPLLAQIGLTYPQYVVLLALWECDGLTIGELGQRVALDSGTLTPLLKRMQVQGLVERTRSAADERQVLITLTRQGAELGQHGSTIQEQVACATACSDRERHDLTQALQTLRSSLLTNAGA